MNKETVLKIVDSCFHKFASSYRNDAVNQASELFDKLSERQTADKVNDTDKSEVLNIPFVNASFLSDCTRVEVIDNTGRAYVNWKPTNKVRVMMQDDNRTLKIIVD